MQSNTHVFLCSVFSRHDLSVACYTRGAFRPGAGSPRFTTAGSGEESAGREAGEQAQPLWPSPITSTFTMLLLRSHICHKNIVISSRKCYTFPIFNRPFSRYSLAPLEEYLRGRKISTSDGFVMAIEVRVHRYSATYHMAGCHGPRSSLPQRQNQSRGACESKNGRWSQGLSTFLGNASLPGWCSGNR